MLRNSSTFAFIHFSTQYELPQIRKKYAYKRHESTYLNLFLIAENAIQRILSHY